MVEICLEHPKIVEALSKGLRSSKLQVHLHKDFKDNKNLFKSSKEAHLRKEKLIFKNLLITRLFQKNI